MDNRMMATALKLARGVSFYPMLSREAQEELEETVLRACIKGALSAKVGIVQGMETIVVKEIG